VGIWGAAIRVFVLESRHYFSPTWRFFLLTSISLVNRFFHTTTLGEDTSKFVQLDYLLVLVSGAQNLKTDNNNNNNENNNNNNNNKMNFFAHVHYRLG